MFPWLLNHGQSVEMRVPVFEFARPKKTSMALRMDGNENVAPAQWQLIHSNVVVHVDTSGLLAGVPNPIRPVVPFEALFHCSAMVASSE